MRTEVYLGFESSCVLDRAKNILAINQQFQTELHNYIEYIHNNGTTETLAVVQEVMTVHDKALVLWERMLEGRKGGLGVG